MAAGGVEPLAFTDSVRFQVVAVADETVGAGVGDAVPVSGDRCAVRGFPGAAPLNDDFVAALYDKNIFHGTSLVDGCSEQL